MGLMPKRTKAAIRIWRNFTLTRIVGIIMAMMVAFLLGSFFVYEYLKIPFMIFAMVVFIILTSKSPTNPQKTFYSGMLQYFRYYSSAKSYRRNSIEKADTESEEEKSSSD